MDVGGRIAATGKVDEDRLATLLQNPYFGAPFPKSLDRFDFPAHLADGLAVEDGAALLTAFAAAAVGRAVALLPGNIRRLVICGGGRRNPTLMDAIAHRSGVRTDTAEALGWRGDAIEAECFAYLAARRVAGLDASYPGTTGVPAPMPAGRLVHPHGSATLPASGDAG
jgi:anhydro-N-acetylmuramic acid kinase